MFDSPRLRNDGDGGALLGLRREQVVRLAQPAAAGHRLRDDRRLARNVAADEARDQPAVVVVGAARAEADIKVDGLALEKLIAALCRRGLRQHHRAGRKHGRGSRGISKSSNRHCFVPVVRTGLDYMPRRPFSYTISRIAAGARAWLSARHPRKCSSPEQPGMPEKKL